MLIQRGRNSLYPESIEVWKPGMKVPEWLSDRAKVDLVDLGNADKILKIIELSSGGYEIPDSSGKNTLIRAPKDGYVCFGDNKIFALDPKALELLYEEKKRR